MIRVISLLWGVVLPVLFVVAAPAEERFELFADGTTEYEIVIPKIPQRLYAGCTELPFKE